MTTITDDTAAKLREAAEVCLQGLTADTRDNFHTALGVLVTDRAKTVLALLDERDELGTLLAEAYGSALDWSDLCRQRADASLLARSTALEAERDAEKARADAAEARINEWSTATGELKRKIDDAEATISTLTAERDALIGTVSTYERENLILAEERDALKRERTRALSQLEAGTDARLTYDEVEAIILKTETPELSDRGDKIWTRRMAVALANLFNARLSALASPSPAPEAEPVGDYDPHRYAVVSSDYSHPFLLGAYAALENATRAQGGNPDKWDIFVKVGTPTPAVDADAVIEAVAAERNRQTSVEGWTAAHDDAHTDFSLAKAACIYAVGATLDGPDRAVMDTHGASGTPGWMKDLWPWDIKWWKPTSRRRDLVKAAALIIAEIERLDRALSLPPSADKGE